MLFRATSMLSAAAAGLGIALLPAEIAEDDIRAKRLVEFCPTGILRKSASVSCSPPTAALCRPYGL